MKPAEYKNARFFPESFTPNFKTVEGKPKPPKPYEFFEKFGPNFTKNKNTSHLQKKGKLKLA